MSRIRCPECGKKIKKNAEACKRCGKKVSEITEQDIKRRKLKDFLSIVLFIGYIVLSVLYLDKAGWEDSDGIAYIAVPLAIIVFILRLIVPNGRKRGSGNFEKVTRVLMTVFVLIALMPIVARIAIFVIWIFTATEE